jgi:hypothetical protein
LLNSQQFQEVEFISRNVDEVSNLEYSRELNAVELLVVLRREYA